MLVRLRRGPAVVVLPLLPLLLLPTAPRVVLVQSLRARRLSLPTSAAEDARK